jgi:hypothetical protein
MPGKVPFTSDPVIRGSSVPAVCTAGLPVQSLAIVSTGNIGFQLRRSADFAWLFNSF